MRHRVTRPRNDRTFQSPPSQAAALQHQTASPITTEIKSAASAAGIPVIGVSETLPLGMSFQQWQLGRARALRQALAR
jgi:zinc/manganese transport system substrate-binding protein